MLNTAVRSFIDANPRRAHKRPLRQIIITITQLDLSKTVSALQDDNHKSRGSALALTMEIESVRERLGGEKERLEDQVDELKGKLSKADAERQRLFLDNEDMRRMVNSKDANCNNVAATCLTPKKFTVFTRKIKVGPKCPIFIRVDSYEPHKPLEKVTFSYY